MLVGDDDDCTVAESDKLLWWLFVRLYLHCWKEIVIFFLTFLSNPGLSHSLARISHLTFYLGIFEFIRSRRHRQTFEMIFCYLIWTQIWITKGSFNIYNTILYQLSGKKANIVSYIYIYIYFISTSSVRNFFYLKLRFFLFRKETLVSYQSSRLSIPCLAVNYNQSWDDCV